MKFQQLGAIFLSLAGTIAAQSTFTPARPPAIPLAVKSPYLSTWLPAGSSGGNGGYLAGEWPVFWTNQITGWAGMIRVDGQAYTWMGNPTPRVDTVTQTSFEYTSTKSIFTMEVGSAVEMTITFLSPVTPNDLKRQSLVFSYLNVEIKSLDGNSHDVQLYTDISAEWVSGNRGDVAQWEYGVTGNVAYHKVWKQTQLLFSENTDQAEWGNVYWATDNVDNLTYQSGRDTDVRTAFQNNGHLSNTKDTTWRAINNNWPVFGFAVDLGSVGATSVKTLFSLGLAQEQAIQFDGASGLVSVPSLWTDYFENELAAVEFFQGDYESASTISANLDDQIERDSLGAAGQDYLTITSLSARQAFGGTQLCGTREKMYMFMKEISSSGNVNTVDVVFPAHTIFLYTNPELLKLQLDPLFENQESGHYPNTYAMHDVGRSYPNATGHPDGSDEPMPLEECGNMILMSLAYAFKANDNNYLSQHYPILQQWVGYLIDEALYPADQLSTDDFSGHYPNQTNLALKGMIAIEAMSVIADLTGHQGDADNYSSIAHGYIDMWQTLGIAHDANPPHTTLGYGQNDTHGLLYNLYADAELGLKFVPQSVYDMQSNFYPTVENTYGVPLDTRHGWTKGDWEVWVAAIASTETRDMFLRDLVKFINETPTSRALTDFYETDSAAFGNAAQFVARTVWGAAFALLTMDLRS